MTFVLAIVVFILFLLTITLGARGDKRYSWFEYYVKGKESGFTIRQSKDLKDLARVAGLTDPTEIFWSLKALDRVISAITRSRSSSPQGLDRETEQLLERMYEYRRRMEFEQPKYKTGIRSSHQLAANQRIRILVHGVGVFNSTLIDVHARYLVCTYPIGVKLPSGFAWKGRRVSVYFWRHEDAGYVFDTYVIDDLRIRSVPVLHLAHSEALFRTQKRKSVRARSRISAYLYLLKRVEGAYEKPERAAGLKCVVQDLSEDGFAVMIGGKAKEGISAQDPVLPWGRPGRDERYRKGLRLLAGDQPLPGARRGRPAQPPHPQSHPILCVHFPGSGSRPEARGRCSPRCRGRQGGGCDP